MSAVPQGSCEWQDGFLKVLPAIQTHAQIQFRRLPRERREDAIQEAIASACVSYQLLAAKGKLAVAHPGTLARYAVNHVRNHRHVGGRQNGAKDALSPICRRRRQVEIVSCDRDRVPASLRGGTTNGWKKIAMEDRKVPVPDLAAFRIDFPRWLRMLTGRDRKIVYALTSGERTSAVAERFGLSEGRVSQLRRKFEQLWRTF